MMNFSAKYDLMVMSRLNKTYLGNRQKIHLKGFLWVAEKIKRMHKYKLRSKSKQQGIWLRCWVLIHTVDACRKFTFKAGLHLVFFVLTKLHIKHQSLKSTKLPGCSWQGEHILYRKHGDIFSPPAIFRKSSPVAL